MKNPLDLFRNSGSVDFRVLLNRFSRQIRGVISTLRILPPEFNAKIGQNNPENRRTLNFERGLFIFSILTIALSAEVVINSENSPLSNDPKELYLDLMKKCLTDVIYDRDSRRENGTDWPTYGHSMIGMKRMNNLHQCIADVLDKQIPGDFIETGVWRGGATIFMRAALKAYNDIERRVWVADSFQGVPVPNAAKYPHDISLNLYTCRELSVPMEQVMENFRKYGLFDSQVIFVRGWFCDTLPTLPIEKIAILRMDGDLYESTINALENLYPKLSIGGYVIVDDYNIDACKQAVYDYRNTMNIKEPLIFVGDDAAVYWMKSE